VLAIHGGVCVDLSQMNKILAVREADLDCTVQAGVTRKQLNDHIRHTGSCSRSTRRRCHVGGMAATRASGTNAVRYGTMRENVISLTVVLADGRVIRTSRRARKSSAGYDLTRMFVGSEGTLGIITEVTLRLYAIPEAMSAAVCSFKDMAGAVDTVIQTLQSASDRAQRGAVRHHHARDQRLLQDRLPGAADAVPGIPRHPGKRRRAGPAGAGDRPRQRRPRFQWAARAEERNKLWQARHDAYFACLQLMHGTRCVATDVCVPISRLTECITETAKDIEKASRPIPCSATSATATSIAYCWCVRTTRPTWPKRAPSTSGWSAGPGDGGHLHRRARHRLRQAEVAGARARRRRRTDARHQAHVRSGQPDESREGLSRGELIPRA